MLSVQRRWAFWFYRQDAKSAKDPSGVAALIYYRR